MSLRPNSSANTIVTVNDLLKYQNWMSKSLLVCRLVHFKQGKC